MSAAPFLRFFKDSKYSSEAYYVLFLAEFNNLLPAFYSSLEAVLKFELLSNKLYIVFYG